MPGLPNRAPTPKEVQNGIQAIRQFYEMGKNWLDKSVREEAQRATLSQARQFAKTFTDHQLETLEALVKRHRFLLSRRHIIRVLNVTPASKRMSLLSRAIKNGWNAPRLEAELRRVYGKHNKGRPPQPPDDAIALAFYLRRAASWWVRLSEVKPGLRRPGRVKARMEGVWEAMSRLQVELERWRPKTLKENR